MLEKPKRLTLKSFILRAALGAATALVAIVIWQTLDPSTASQSQAGGGLVFPHPDLADPEHVVAVRVAPTGDVFYWRDGGVERLDANGGTVWRGVSIERPIGLPPMDVYSVAPTHGGDLLAIGVVADESRKMGIYRLRGDDGKVEVVGLYSNMDPVDLAETPDGGIFALAVPSADLNEALHPQGHDEVSFELGWIHEIGPDGGLGRSLMTREYHLATQRDAERAIDDIHEHRLLVDPAGDFYVYGTGSGLVQKIDRRSGLVVGSIPLSHAGFTAKVRVLNIQFHDWGNLVYSLAEFDADDTVTGSQTYLLNLATGSSRLLSDQRAERGLWATHYNPVRGTLVSIDILDDGAGGIRDLPWTGEGIERPERGLRSAR